VDLKQVRLTSLESEWLAVKIIRRLMVAFVLMVTVFGCLEPLDLEVRPPGFDPVGAETPLLPGWKCPASNDMDHVVAVANPPCSWVPGASLAPSCQKEMEEHRLLAYGCVRVPKVPIWYVMLPSLDAERRLNPNVPIKDWDIFKPYKTRAECQTAVAALKPRKDDVADRRTELMQPVGDTPQDELAAQAPYAQCASSDVARPDW
jgi:hypothetical protein